MAIINHLKNLGRIMIAMLGFIVFSNTAFSAEVTNQDNDAATQETEDGNRFENREIEEIVISIPRSFFSFRAQIENAEQKLFSTYNDANTDEDKDYDVNCRRSDWTMTHITEQICWPTFFENIVADHAQAVFRREETPLTIPQLKRNASRQFEALRANIQEVAFENPSVARALVEFDTLEKTYNQRRAECMKKPAVLFLFRRCP